MATLGKWSGGVDADLDPGTSWAEPTTLFPTEDRNDGSAYGKSNATITLPSSGLADGYLFVGAYEFEDTSNGRCNPQGRFIQASGTGTFVGGPTGGYNRDTSEDRSYIRCWAFVDNPSASSTYTFQWKRDSDAPNTGDGTVRSELQVIPFYYSNHGIYSSTSASLYGGTTPNQVTGWSASDESDTAAIELVSNVVTVKTDNKRYLVLGSQFFEGRGGRTQRWHGLEIDGTLEDAAKAYSMYRSTSNDESGDLFTWMLNRVTTDITIEQVCYRGDGVSALQGGADVDGSTPSVGDHALVVLELNDDAEVFLSRDTNQSALLATTGPVDLDVNETTDFNDTASFTDVTVSSINCVQTSDYLFGANVAAASNSVSDGTRWTAYAEFTINGTENADSVAGDYMRNNQSSQDCFGWSANLLGFEALTAGDDVGVSVTELSGSEGGGAAVSPAGWTGFWGINLDTLEAAGTAYSLSCEAGSYTLTGQDACINTTGNSIHLGTTVNDINLISTNVIDTCPDGDTAYSLTIEAGSYTITGTVANLEYHSVIDIGAGSYSISGTAASLEYHSVVSIEAGSYSLTGTAASLEYHSLVGIGSGSYSISGTDANLEYHQLFNAEAGSYTITGADATLVYSIRIGAESGSYAITGTAANLEFHSLAGIGAGAYSITGTASNLELHSLIAIESGSYAISGTAANLEHHAALDVESGSYSITGTDATLSYLQGFGITAESGAYTITGTSVTFLFDSRLSAESSTYLLTGSTVSLIVDLLVSAEANAYVISGTDAELTYTPVSEQPQKRVRTSSWMQKATV